MFYEKKTLKNKLSDKDEKKRKCTKVILGR